MQGRWRRRGCRRYGGGVAGGAAAAGVWFIYGNDLENRKQPWMRAANNFFETAGRLGSVHTAELGYRNDPTCRSDP
jgi:hypothetical protein